MSYHDLNDEELRNLLANTLVEIEQLKERVRDISAERTRREGINQVGYFTEW